MEIALLVVQMIHLWGEKTIATSFEHKYATVDYLVVQGKNWAPLFLPLIAASYFIYK